MLRRSWAGWIGLSASCLALGLAAPASAQTCASPLLITSVGQMIVGNTTGAANEFDDSSPSSATCTLPLGSGSSGPEHVYRFDVTGGNDLSFQLTTSDPVYDPMLYILAQCGVLTSCIDVSDELGSGVDENIGPLQLTPGTYYLYVDSFFVSSGGSGPYELLLSGSLAVELVDFTIE